MKSGDLLVGGQAIFDGITGVIYQGPSRPAFDSDNDGNDAKIGNVMRGVVYFVLDVHENDIKVMTPEGLIGWANKSHFVKAS